jgi:tetratricopeptide (TPR) repeat protein
MKGKRLRQALAILSMGALGEGLGAQGSEDHRYRPARQVPASLESILRHLAPGEDAFPEEKDAEELSARLQELGALLRASPERARDAVDRLLAKDFKGGPLVPAAEESIGNSPHFEVLRAKGLAAETDRDRVAFAEQLSAFAGIFRQVDTAEFLITRIEVAREPAVTAKTIVRYDVVGAARDGGRAQRVGRWQMSWRRDGEGVWRVAEWRTTDHVRSRAPAPVFSEVTGAAFGAIPSFERQLMPGNDAWLSSLDSALQLDTMGLHGMSAGDADGDGWDDLYLAQPAGLPNRLFRNKGDGTFEDVTEAAGVGVLDSTSHSLFADLDNDGDQDLLLVTRTGLLLFTNDGKARFTHVPDAFRFQERLRGSATALAVADYDRDGFLDVYLLTYSYFIGSSEDKSGPATPYHDAQNGPPNVLFRNDGQGRFVDVTRAAGLDQNNDRFSLAAAWADYDGDGWIDLLVANDFGRKNLYHNEGQVNGQVRFKDVAAPAGVEDYGAGMSATWVDYDNDGRLDIYTGNMWTAAGLRVTSLPAFMPGAPAAARALFWRHARGNSLFRNRGDGTFADVTLESRTEMGRWAWSSEPLDFDLDGWEDLFVVNGMFTRDGEDRDLDGFFWRQVVARSPLTRVPGTSFDDGWRAINRLLVSTSAQASHERDVFLRNDGHGGFDDVSGSVGLDLDGDGRSFAAFDYDHDGDLDLAVFAPRSSPQLRLFRNDFPERNHSVAFRLRGTRGNRDALGARVTLETEAGRRTKVLMGGSGFLSQNAKELLFGLGQSRTVKATVVWPSGESQTLTDLPADHRIWIEEGNERPRSEPMTRRADPALPAVLKLAARTLPHPDSWLYQPFPAPEVAGLRGKRAVLVFTDASSRAAASALAGQRAAFTSAGVTLMVVATDGSADDAKTASTFSILNRYLFSRREDLRLPTAFLLSEKGEVVKVYRGAITPEQVLADAPRILATPAERLARAVPFAGRFYTAPGERNYFQYALELAEQGFEAQALGAFKRVAQADPSAITFYNLGTLHAKAGQPAEAKAAFERALQLKADYAEASNSLGALLAQGGDVAGGVARFRAAIEAKPDFADALNNLGYALFQSGRPQEAFELYQRALGVMPYFPEALNNVGIFYGQQGELDRAESYFKQALEARPAYGEAGNNLALVLAAKEQSEAAITLLKGLLEQDPSFEMTYVTLAKIYLGAGRPRDATQVLERLLQRNPKHPLGLQLLQQLRAAR